MIGRRRIIRELRVKQEDLEQDARESEIRIRKRKRENRYCTLSERLDWSIGEKVNKAVAKTPLPH